MDNFFTADMLRTLPGQVAAVLLLVQLVKSMVNLPNGAIQFVAVVAGVALNVGIHQTSGLGFQQWVLVVINGALVAGAAMKTAEATQSVSRGEVAIPLLKSKPAPELPQGLVASRMSPNLPPKQEGDPK